MILLISLSTLRFLPDPLIVEPDTSTPLIPKPDIGKYPETSYHQDQLPSAPARCLPLISFSAFQVSVLQAISSPKFCTHSLSLPL